MKVSVVILNWNGKALLEKYLKGVLEYSLYDESIEVVVADNGSDDKSMEFIKETYPEVRCIDLERNHGYAKGYNKALSLLDSEYAVLLNSDVEVTKNWLSVLINYMDANRDVVACQPKIRDLKNKAYFEYAGGAGGYLDFLGYPFCRGRIFNCLEKDEGQYDNVADVLWATGACLVVRLKDYIEAGGFDEYFFAHMEELDLCWRLKSRGYKIRCVPGSVVFHLGGATLSRENPRKTFLNFRNNLLMVYKNTFGLKFVFVFILRFILDYVFFLKLFFTGNFRDAFAVVRARCNFYKIQKAEKKQRDINKRKKIKNTAPGIYGNSIIFDFYVLGKKKFSQLKLFK